MLTNLLLIVGIAFLATITYKLSMLENLLNDNYAYIDEVVGEDESANQMPDQADEMSDQNLADLLGSEALHVKNLSHDEKIQALIDELNNTPATPNVRPGVVHDVAHDEIDSTYVQVPKVEYAE